MQPNKHSTSADADPTRAETSEEPHPSPTPTPTGARAWSRRRFLAGLAAGMGVLAGCRANPEPTPTPTATKTPVPPDSVLATVTPTDEAHAVYLPSVGNQIGPEPRMTPTPPKVTAAPQAPPPTPTPTVTPFPPGPPSKLGLFVTRNLPEIYRLLRTGGVAVVKTLELDKNFVAEIKQTSPRTKLIGRIHLPQLRLAELDPIPAARAFVEELLVYAGDPTRQPYFDGWESYNEPVPTSPDEMKRYADFEAERVRLLAARGIRSVIGNFGTGQPPLELWEHFFPALQAAKEHDGWLGLHEYSAPTIYYLTTRDGKGRYPGISPEDSGWLTLRYRKVYNQILKPAGLAIPLVMTELGVDGLVTDRPGPANARGWQHFQQYWAENGYGLWGPGAYVEQLVWYDQAMQQDDYVIGGCIYALAASQGWQSYEIVGPVVDILEQYFRVHAPTG